jgi:pimeloyl-ACP methyl ester carboxylesterase
LDFAQTGAIALTVVVAGVATLLGLAEWDDARVAAAATAVGLPPVGTMVTLPSSGLRQHWRHLYVGASDAACVVLALHGFPTSSADWLPLVEGHWRSMPAAVAGCDVWAPDFIGFGLSDKPASWSYTLMGQADAVVEGARQLGIVADRAVHIVAHDIGDTVAQELMARHAECAYGEEAAASLAQALNVLTFTDPAQPQTAVQYGACNATATLPLASVVMLNGGVMPGMHRPLLVQTLLASPLWGPLLSPLVVHWRTYSSSLRATLGPAGVPPGELERAWALFYAGGGRHVMSPVLGYMQQRRQWQWR